MSKKGEGVGRKSPPPPTAYFATLSQFSSRSQAFGKGKETAATQARYGEAPSEFERGTFFALHVYKRVEISQVEVYKRVGKSVLFRYLKGPLTIIFRIHTPFGAHCVPVLNFVK